MRNIRQYKSGIYYQDEFRAQRSWNGNETNVLLRGEGFDSSGLPKFSDVAMAMGADDIKDARGMALGDFDNDGDLDIVINTNPGDCGKQSVPPVLLRNDVGHYRNWVSISLIGSTSNRDAIGAQVKATVVSSDANEIVLLRIVSAGGGYASQNAKPVHFGLGESDAIKHLQIIWPDGQIEEFVDVDCNKQYQVTQGQKTLNVLINMPRKVASR